MFNPFLKRASEHLRDDEAFLATVSPVPVLAHLAPRATALYDRLVLFTGTPGSGKTTFAKLLRFPTLTTLNRLHRLPEHRPLLDAMAQTLVQAVRAIKADTEAARLQQEFFSGSSNPE